MYLFIMDTAAEDGYVGCVPAGEFVISLSPLAWVMGASRVHACGYIRI